jgi:hypothetical protein
MGWKIFAGFILAIVFAPAILAFIAPAVTRVPAFCFVFGGLQIAVGAGLYLAIYAGGVNWPWPLLIAGLGVYYVSRGVQLRQPPVPPLDERHR